MYNEFMDIKKDGDYLENDGLALKLFKDECCDGCSCKSENDHKKEAVLKSSDLKK